MDRGMDKYILNLLILKMDQEIIERLFFSDQMELLTNPQLLLVVWILSLIDNIVQPPASVPDRVGGSPTNRQPGLPAWPIR